MDSATQLPPKFKVALVQMNPKPNDLEANFTHAANQIRKAASSSSSPISLAILPEYHLTGFEPSSPDFVPCCQTSHKYIGLYQELARELNINICAGTLVLTPEPEDPKTKTYSMEDSDRPTLLNTSYFIDNKGEICGSYTKTNLWHPEREHLTSSIDHTLSGSNTNSNNTSREKEARSKPSAHEEALPSPHQVFQTPLGAVGILICWDLAFPEAFRSLIMSGAKIILIPTCWYKTDMSPEGLACNPDAERLFLKNTLIARAYENTCAIIFCNVGGPEEDGHLGLSQVALPILGALEGSFDDGREGVGVVDVDMEIVEMAERNYKVREDLLRDDWHYGYQKYDGQ